MKGETGKAPAIQWYYKDWLSDMQLQMASPSTRGIWANILMFMLSCDPEDPQCGPGILYGVTYQRLMNLGKCSRKEAVTFRKEAEELRFCDIKNERNDNQLGKKAQSFTIISRRLNRDIPEKQRLRNKWKNDKKRQRKDENVHPNVHHESTSSPPASPTPSPTAVINTPASGPFLIKEKIIEKCEQVARLSRKDKFNPYQFANAKIKDGYHPDIVFIAICGIQDSWDNIAKPWGWGMSILKSKQQMYNEKKHIAESQKFKEIWNLDSRIKSLIASIGGIENER